MKKKSLSLYAIAALFSVTACNQTPEKGFQINGEINAESGVIYLQEFRNKMFFVVDSATIENGRFTFTRQQEQPDLYGLTLDKDESFSPWFIFIENGPIEVKIDPENKRSLDVTGSTSQDLFVSYQKADKSSFRIDSFIQANPSSPVAAYILYRDYSYKLTKDEIDKYLTFFDPTLSGSPYIETLKELSTTLDRVAIGKTAPDFTTVSPEGKEIHLTDHLGKGYVLIDFWASWCGPCRRENPNLVKAYQEYKDKGFNIVAVSLDKERENWLAAIDKDHLEWTHGSDLLFWDSEPARLYGIRAIPGNYLVDAEGTIIAKNLRGEELQATLKKLLQ